MSLSAVASYSADKGCGFFEQSCEELEADFFDQFLAFDPTENDSPGYSAMQESTHLGQLRRMPAVEATDGNSFNDDPAISQNHTSALGSHFYSELSARAVHSESELLGLENISLGSPLSPLSQKIRANSVPSKTFSPPRTSDTVRRRACMDSTPQILGKTHSSAKKSRSPIRKSGNSPQTLRGSENFQNGTDVWGNILNPKFRFDFENSVAPMTPPNTTRLSSASNSSSSSRLVKDPIDDIFEFNDGLPKLLNSRPRDYKTPLATPVLDGQHSRKTSSQQPFSDGVGCPTTPQFHRSSGSWSQIAGSSEMNNWGNAAFHSPEVDAPVWWNHAATAPLAQPSPTALHINPRRATQSLAYHLQNDLSYESNRHGTSSKVHSGLMIQIPGAPAQQSFVVSSPHMKSPYMSQQGYFGYSLVHTPRNQYSPPPCPYEPVPAPYQQDSRPSRKSRSSVKQRSDSPSPRTASSGFHIRKRRTTKGSKERKTTPNTGTVDFVNFTPSDRRKILTGVAPSGSSKTRARREKEAMEKRRKLSMAALRAVRAAGGDVDSLVEQGLFV